MVTVASSSTTSERSTITTISDHAREKWAERADCGPTNLFAAWYEADPVEYPSARGDAYCRYHERAGVVMLAKWGELVTCIDLSDRPPQEQRIVRDQLED